MEIVMDEYKKKILENAGIDMDEVLERFMGNTGLMEIGRASCRERVYPLV